MQFQIVSLLALCYFAVADEGYASNCNSLELYQPGFAENGPANNVMFSGNCAQDSGVYNVDTSININTCFSNTDGALSGNPNGGFGATCQDLSLSGTIIHASCKNDYGNYVDTSIDTWYYIGNSNGEMTCFGRTIS